MSVLDQHQKVESSEVVWLLTIWYVNQSCLFPVEWLFLRNVFFTVYVPQGCFCSCNFLCFQRLQNSQNYMSLLIILQVLLTQHSSFQTEHFTVSFRIFCTNFDKRTISQVRNLTQMGLLLTYISLSTYSSAFTLYLTPLLFKNLLISFFKIPND